MNLNRLSFGNSFVEPAKQELSTKEIQTEKEIKPETLRQDQVNFKSNAEDREKVTKSLEIHNAKIKASLVSTLLPFVGFTYYALRYVLKDPKKMCDKNALDMEKELEKQKQIKKAQLKASFISILPGLGLLPLVYYALIEDPKKA